jgi:hypothetical protein
MCFKVSNKLENVRGGLRLTRSFGMWHSVVYYKGTDVSEDSAASKFKLEGQ